MPSSMPILHQSLQFIDCYSPSLRRFSASNGLRLPSFMPILHLSLQFIDCYSPLLHRFSQVSSSDCPLSCLYCISRFTSLIVTVFLSAGFRKYRAQIALLQTYYTSVASSYWFLQFFASQVWLVPADSDCPLLKAYRVNIAPYYLFTQKNF